MKCYVVFEQADYFYHGEPDHFAILQVFACKDDAEKFIIELKAKRPDLYVKEKGQSLSKYRLNVKETTYVK